MSDTLDLQFNQNEFNYLEVIRNPFQNNKIMFIQMEKVAQDKQNPVVGAFYELAIYYFNKKMYAKSAMYYEKAMEIDTEYHLGYADYIYTLYKQGKVNEAAKWADILNNVPSDNFWAVQYYKAIIAIARKQFRLALKDINNGILYCNNSEKIAKFFIPKKGPIERIITKQKRSRIAIAFLIFEIIVLTIVASSNDNIASTLFLVVALSVYLASKWAMQKP